MLYQPHPLYPPLLKRRGGRFYKEGLTPLLNTPKMGFLYLRRGGMLIFEGANAPLKPLPAVI